MAAFGLYQVMRGIAKGGPMLVGEVAAHNSDGTSVIAFLDGALMAVIGTGVPVGQRAFVQEGRVVSQASSLPFLGDIEV